ncbi:MAG: ATP-binding protein [Candidatus Paceibacterota bacterium]|jgi:hypothetical protein
MLIFKRKIEDIIVERLYKRRAILIFGPRQAGKTTLAKRILERQGNRDAYFNCELATVRKHFILGEPNSLLSLVGNAKLVVFDEAQTIENIGPILKTFIDTYPEVQIIATGSSSFDLANKINEPLTGRAFEFILLPLSLNEIQSVVPLTEERVLELLRLGCYPSVVAETSKSTREDILRNIATNYLYKDIFIFESVRNPKLIEDLLRALALQVGSTVSINELAILLGVSRATIQKYLSLLEQSYVVFRLPSFSRNPRNEIKKAFKVYFYDVGIRNALIDNIDELTGRNDRGPLLENLFITERLKLGLQSTLPPRLSFWRTKKGAEIDLIEEIGDTLRAYECKWKDGDTSFSLFRKKYSTVETHLITLATLIR